MKKLNFLLLCLCFCLGGLSAQTVFVNAAAAGGDGTSWATAYNDLDVALATAPAGASLWVVAGTYTPASTFQVLRDMTILGGFNGTETSAGQADPETNVTLLSGDVNGDDDAGDILINRTDNVRIMAVDSFLNLVTINGFTFSGGQLADTPTDESIDEYSGGAFRTYSPINVSDCSFASNAADFGSAVVLFFGADNSTFDNIIVASNLASGNGAIYGELISNLTVSNSLFSANQASRGALYGQDMTGLSLTNTNFDGNIASSRGGSVGVVRCEPVLVDNCSFTNNIAQRAAAIYMFQDIDANRPLDPNDHVITNTTFDGNLSEQRGGAIYDLYTNTLQRNNTYTNNSSSTDNGGAYYASNSGQVHIIDSCRFENNTALSSRAGGYYIGGAVDIELTNTDFIGNECGNRGAGFYMLGSFDTLAQDITINIDNVNFLNNTGASTGGAFYIQSPVNTTRLNIANSSFSGNITTGGLGGAIGGISGFVTTIDNCEFIGNSSPASSAGAIFFSDRLFDDFLDTDTFSLTITNTSFNSNAAFTQGGAIDLRGGLNTTVTNSEFLGNLITDVDGGAGGGIIMNGDSGKTTTFLLVNNTFLENGAVALGDDIAVYLDPIEQADDPKTRVITTIQNNAFTSQQGLGNIAVEDGTAEFVSLGGNFFLQDIPAELTLDVTDILDTDADPEDLFVNIDYSSEDGDLHPSDGSPLINAGTSGPLVPADDITGAIRDANPDIGAYEAGAVALQTVAEIIAESPVHNVLEGALNLAGLTATLNGDGPFTVFAPTDAAFALVDPAVLAAIQSNAESLSNTLLTHVVGDDLRSNELTDGLTASSLAPGTSLNFTNDGAGTITVTTPQAVVATVTVADLLASNGVVHVIDMLLIPAIVAVRDLEGSGIQVEFFPNPVQNLMNVRVDELGVQEMNISIINLNGQRINNWSLSNGNNTINFSRVPAGTYTLEIDIDGKVYSKQVVKQ